jgi:hypothetical protein
LRCFSLLDPAPFSECGRSLVEGCFYAVVALHRWLVNVGRGVTVGRLSQRSAIQHTDFLQKREDAPNRRLRSIRDTATSYSSACEVIGYPGGQRLSSSAFASRSLFDTKPGDVPNSLAISVLV